MPKKNGKPKRRGAQKKKAAPRAKPAKAGMKKKKAGTIYAPAREQKAATIWNPVKSIQSKFDIKHSARGAVASFSGPIFVGSFNATDDVQGFYNNYLYNTANVQIGANLTFPVCPTSLIPRASPAYAILSFSKFRFLELKITWVGMCPTSLNNGYAFAFNPDGAYYAQMNNAAFIEIVSAPNSMIMPCYQSTTLDLSSCLTRDWYYTDADIGTITNDSGHRQSYQGIIVGRQNGNGESFGGPVDNGILYVEAVVELACPQPYAQNFAVAPPLKSMKRINAKTESKERPDDFVKVDEPERQPQVAVPRSLSRPK